MRRRILLVLVGAGLDTWSVHSWLQTTVTHQLGPASQKAVVVQRCGAYVVGKKCVFRDTARGTCLKTLKCVWSLERELSDALSWCTSFSNGVSSRALKDEGPSLPQDLLSGVVHANICAWTCVLFSAWCMDGTKK